MGSHHSLTCSTAGDRCGRTPGPLLKTEREGCLFLNGYRPTFSTYIISFQCAHNFLSYLKLAGSSCEYPFSAHEGSRILRFLVCSPQASMYFRSHTGSSLVASDAVRASLLRGGAAALHGEQVNLGHLPGVVHKAHHWAQSQLTGLRPHRPGSVPIDRAQPH